jgi:hypothetical protein
MAALQDSSLIQTLETDHMLIKIPAAQYPLLDFANNGNFKLGKAGNGYYV